MEGEIDGLEFMLAEALGKHLHEIRELGNSEIQEWAGYYSWRQKVHEFELKKAGRGG